MRQNLDVTALCVLDSQGRILLVRKRGTRYWMQPGGKPEPGETPEQTGLREAYEELGVRWGAERLQPLGTWHGLAANEPDTGLTAHVFQVEWDPVHDGVASVGAELAECAWVDPAQALARDDVAPLLREYVLPLMLGLPLRDG